MIHNVNFFIAMFSYFVLQIFVHLPVTLRSYHKMQKLEADAKELRKQAIRSEVRKMEHACQCRVDNCQFPGCQKLKRVISHAKRCKVEKRVVSCGVCKQVVALNCFHAESCEEKKCLVPFCPAIQFKMRPSRIIVKVGVKGCEDPDGSAPGSPPDPETSG